LTWDPRAFEIFSRIDALRVVVQTDRLEHTMQVRHRSEVTSSCADLGGTKGPLSTSGVVSLRKRTAAKVETRTRASNVISAQSTKRGRWPVPIARELGILRQHQWNNGIRLMIV
jgi:hypothetical protein